VLLWRDEVDTGWRHLRARLQRVRNSLAHGGPYTDDVIHDVVDYARDLERIQNA
jgi:hypothetical protein